MRWRPAKVSTFNFRGILVKGTACTGKDQISRYPRAVSRREDLRQVGQPLLQLVFKVLDIINHLVVRPLSRGERFDERQQFLYEHRVDIRIWREVEQVLQSSSREL